MSKEDEKDSPARWAGYTLLSVGGIVASLWFLSEGGFLGFLGGIMGLSSLVLFGGSVFSLIDSLKTLSKDLSEGYIPFYEACKERGLTKVETADEIKLELLVAKTFNNPALVKKVTREPGEYFRLGQHQAKRKQGKTEIAQAKAQQEAAQKEALALKKERDEARNGALRAETKKSELIGADKYIKGAQKKIAAAKQEASQAEQDAKNAKNATKAALFNPKTKSPGVRGAAATIVAGSGVGAYTAMKTDADNKARKETADALKDIFSPQFAQLENKANERLYSALGTKAFLEKQIAAVKGHLIDVDNSYFDSMSLSVKETNQGPFGTLDALLSIEAPSVSILGAAQGVVDGSFLVLAKNAAGKTLGRAVVNGAGFDDFSLENIGFESASEGHIVISPEEDDIDLTPSMVSSYSMQPIHIWAVEKK